VFTTHFLLGVQASAPKTFPRNIWLQEFMEEAFGETKVFKSYCAQLDAFAKHMSWSERTVEEKSNQLEDHSWDPFLQGVQAVLELYFYGIPVATVCFVCSSDFLCVVCS
jgi:hypothetical protein